MIGDKLYCGCSGFSILETDLPKTSTTTFYSGTRKLLGKQSINSICIHDDLLYTGGTSVDGTAGKVLKSRAANEQTLSEPFMNRSAGSSFVFSPLLNELTRTKFRLFSKMNEHEQKPCSFVYVCECSLTCSFMFECVWQFISVFSFYILFKCFKIPTNKIFNKYQCIICILFMNTYLCSFVSIGVHGHSFVFVCIRCLKLTKTNTNTYISLTNEHEQGHVLLTLNRFTYFETTCFDP
ncbi:hypothetical protein Hanom_Chr12g01099281 [Helianthus anomalus]